jgi:hypothetical protein
MIGLSTSKHPPRLRTAAIHRIRFSALSLLLILTLGTFTLPLPGQLAPQAPNPKNDPKTLLAVRQETLRIGIESETDLVLSKGNLLAKRVEPQSPVILRVIAIRPLSDGRFIYRVAFTPLEPGTFNLSDYLVFPDDTPLGGTEAHPVTIAARVTNPDQTTLVGMPLAQTSPATQYATWMVLLGLLWAAAGVRLFYKKNPTPQPSPPPPPPPPTLADLLRPLVQLAASGDLDIPGKARLERIFLHYWSQQLNLQKLTPIEKIRAIRKHPEAGLLFRTMDAWIHRPEPVIPEDEIAAVLAPYAEIDAPEESQKEAAS